MNVYHMKIAGISIQVRSEVPLELTEDFLPFQVEPEAEPMEVFDISLADAFPPMEPPHCWDPGGRGRTEWNDHPVVLHRLGPKEPYLMEEVCASGWRKASYLRSENEQPRLIRHIFNNMPLEELLQRHGALLLHSSFIRWNGKGILFSAPSGTGKSTQADLWGRYMGSETLNGDRSGLRKVNGVWTAYGLPYAGSSGIYRNESAPIAAIVMLSQEGENRIRRLSPAQCLRRILPEVTLHRWDPAFMNWGLDQLTELLCAVPCYHLGCLPDQDAVQLLYETIIQEV